jgi:signal transduction histidine kinase
VDRSRARRYAIGIGGTIAALAAEWLALAAGASPDAVLLNLAIGLTYLYGGLAIWGRAPANRTGAKMAAVGLTWFIGSAAGSDVPVIGDLSAALQDLYAAFLLTLVLSYPSGVLETRVNRIGIAVMLFGTTALQVANMLPTPLLLNEGTNGFYVALALAVMASGLIIRRWVLAPARMRSDLLPVLLAGAVYVITIALNIIRRIALVPDSTAELLIAIVALAPAAIPVSLLIGFYRQSEHRLQALVDAIPDPIIRLGRDGRPLDPETATDAGERPSTGPAVALRRVDVELATERVATRDAIVHALDEDRLQSVDVTLERPAGRRELEIRLAPSGPDEVIAIVRDFTDQRAAEAEVRASRARIVEASDAERRRVERNLHDGAQQRLVALSLALRRAQSQVADDADPELASTLAAASDQLKTALAELRELARGIHPAILTEAGLGPAMRELARGSTVPVRVRIDLPDEVAEPVAAAAYYVVAEALTNVAKYAEASAVDLSAEVVDGELRVEVADDGRGGAVATGGSGLRGLNDRVAALGGRIDVRSTVGQGTTVAAWLPLETVDRRG